MAALRMPGELFAKIRKVQAEGFNPAWTQLAVKAMASEGEAVWQIADSANIHCRVAQGVLGLLR